ncbi:MAG: trypsin-like peptidase domain-containing protein [Clostridia bacterium]|nr:trypsin-like peptidase domain-containing protein [Clostridia bacterium]
MKVVQKKKNNKIIIIAILLMVAWFGIFLLLNTYSREQVNSSNYKTARLESTNYSENVEKVEEKSKNLADVIENVTKSVVGISKLKNTGNSILGSSSESQLGLGTGIIVSTKGYILSNQHLTGEKYSKCYVTLEDGRSFEGSVVWSDVDLDLSIIKISAKDLSAVTLADSNSIRVGESVYAIGNPIGFEFRRTVTSGIISAKNRTIKLEEGENQSYMTDLIQTDATINPGNSGGPLIYPNGEVIGINTVKISSAEGIGFAVPINVVKNVINGFEETDKFEEATIGIFAYDKEVIPYLTSINPNFNKGIYVARIIANGPASKTELKEGDIIISFDGREINTMNELREYIFTKKPEDEVTLKIQRGKINREITIKLGKK